MLLLFWHTRADQPAPPNPTVLGGGGEEDLERYRAQRRKRKQDIEDWLRKQKLEAEALKERLAKAEADRKRKTKAKSDSKAKRAIEARIDRFTRELAAAEAEIQVLLQALAELQISLVDQELSRRRALLLMVIASA